MPENDILTLVKSGHFNPKTVNKADSDGWTALHYVALAEAQGRDVSGLAEILLQQGADPHIGDAKGDTPFNIAAPASPRTGRLMTNHWFNLALAGKGLKGLNDPSGSHGSTLAQYIAKWSNDDEIESQISRGVAKGMVIDRANASGWTPLTAAAAMGRAKAVEVFARHYSQSARAIKTVDPYTADYKGQKVTYPVGITALEVAQARLEQDKALSPELRAGLEEAIEVLKRYTIPHKR